MDDDAESIITNERYNYISSIIQGCYLKKSSPHHELPRTRSTAGVTNRFLALPIFAVIMHPGVLHFGHHRGRCSHQLDQ